MTGNEWQPEYAEIPALFRAGRLRFSPALPNCFGRFVAYCYVLHRHADVGDFELSSGVMGHVLGVSRQAAACHIAALASLKMICRTKPGRGRAPAEYRFVGSVTTSEEKSCPRSATSRR